MTDDQKFLNIAVRLAINAVKKGGGPFGALIVKDGKIISRSANMVILTGDPTAHAEVLSIRKAARKLKTHDLSGSVLYCSCEPCPMCLGAVYWARLSMVVYAAKRSDAANAGFVDNLIYDEMKLDPAGRKIIFRHLQTDNASEAFRIWQDKEDKVPY
jgi:tRNA(Arg) A34 adenosine deaminase TadA